MLTFAVTAFNVLTWVATCIAMGVAGTIVWKLLQRQEADDPEFQKKLDDDDARARRNRGE
jgi:cytochrome c-type biogenesis protein CcmH/NrfF